MKTPPYAGPVLRVLAALFLCAVCFQVGRWTGQLENRAVAANPIVTPAKAAELAEPKTLTTLGTPVGEGEDIITPLNVRDPAALVMGPGAGAPYSGSATLPPEPQAVPASPARKLRKKPLPEGRLLDLMKKKDASPEQPKVY
jgi:hypothetical protein